MLKASSWLWSQAVSTTTSQKASVLGFEVMPRKQALRVHQYLAVIPKGNCTKYREQVTFYPAVCRRFAKYSAWKSATILLTAPPYFWNQNWKKSENVEALFMAYTLRERKTNLMHINDQKQFTAVHVNKILSINQSIDRSIHGSSWNRARVEFKQSNNQSDAFVES